MSVCCVLSDFEQRKAHVSRRKLDRPVALKVRPEEIPDTLKSMRNWALWSYEYNRGLKKWDKPPLFGASSTDPETWRTFDSAYDLYLKLEADGLYWALPIGHRMTGGDFDNCLNDGQILPNVENLVQTLNTYTEKSPSGKGLRTINFGSKPGNRCKTVIDEVEHELYDQGRWLSVTGHRLNDFPDAINDDPRAIIAVYNALFGDEPPPQSRIVQRSDLKLSDEDVIKKAVNAKDGPKFKRLFYDGDTSEYDFDDSRADAGLCSLIRFWVGDDPVRIDSLFRESQLIRPKWDEPRGDSTYGERTIRRVIELGGDVYKGSETSIKEPEQDGLTCHVDVTSYERPAAKSAWYDGDMSSVTIHVNGKPILKQLPEIVPVRVLGGPKTIKELLDVFHEHLYFEEDYNVTGPVCAFLCNFTPQDPGIVGIVGPSGSIKTEMMRSFGEVQNQFCYPISSITENTLISGMDKNIDTIPLLRGRVLTIKDLTTLLSKNEDIRSSIFADFREVTDGFIHKEFGNGVKKEYHDIHSTILFASTPAIERYYSMYANLGTRMLFMRPQNDPIKARKKSRENQVAGIKPIRKTLQDAMLSFVDVCVTRLLGEPLPGIPGEIEDEIGEFCDVLAWLRHPLHDDLKGYIDEICPDPEFPTRLMNSICLLTQMHAFIHKRAVVDMEHDLEFARRIVADNVPTNRAAILTYLTDEWQSTSVLSQYSGINPQSLYHPLDELSVLGLAKKVSREDAPKMSLDGRSSHYRLAPDWSQSVQSLYGVIRLGGRVREKIKDNFKGEDTLVPDHTIQKSGDHAELVRTIHSTLIAYRDARSDQTAKVNRTNFVNQVAAVIRVKHPQWTGRPIEDDIQRLNESDSEIQSLLAELTEVV